MSKEILFNVKELINKYSIKFKQLPKDNLLTEYEKAFGFNRETRVGSRNFNNQFGRFFEELCELSVKFEKSKLLPFDGMNEFAFFQCKSKFNTMKGSQIKSELGIMLEKANKLDKDFYLLILVDKRNLSRNCPLEHFSREIKKIENYDPERHKLISGDEIYNYLFEEDGISVKELILEQLQNLK